MTTSVSKSSIYIAFFWLLLLLFFINGIQIMGDDECIDYYPSVIWKGPCFVVDHCDTQCREKEGALRGDCGQAFKCLCEYDCNYFDERPSAYFKGLCSSSVSCSRLCREKENSYTGHCAVYHCWCSYMQKS